MTRELWIDRTFVFDVPPGRFASVLERLRGTACRLEERTQSLNRAGLVCHDNGQWSIQEHVGHLLDLETLWYRRAQQLLAGNTVLEAADLANSATREAQHNRRQLSVLLRGFRATRIRLVLLLEGADAAMIVRSAWHPRLQQPMRLLDHALFVAEHDDHHLATITELRRRLGVL